MRRFLLMLCIFGVAVLAGCGGGGGGGTAATTPTVTLSVPSGAAPDGVTPTVAYKAAADIPGHPTGSKFVSAAQTLPAGTSFTQQVTLTFTLTSPLGASDQVLLFQTDAAGNWTQVSSAQVTISSDRATATVNVTSFSAQGYYAIFKIS
ncbi:MAG: hypothetical protein M1133_03700 [Armatimonadetes bacterium]|nr:hypothetical protein [Armatimonadota bacterium]